MTAYSQNQLVSLPNAQKLAATYGGTQVVAARELMWLDSSGVAQPITAATDQGNQVQNEDYFGPKFLGIAAERKMVTDAAGTIDVLTSGVQEFNCDATNFAFGDKVKLCVDVNGVGTSLKVAQTSDANAAIGVCVRKGTSVTKVLVAFKAQAISV